jgi:hypothetical protein
VALWGFLEGWGLLQFPTDFCHMCFGNPHRIISRVAASDHLSQARYLFAARSLSEASRKFRG